MPPQLGVTPKRGDGAQQLAPVAERNAELFEILLGQIRKDIEIDVIVGQDAGQRLQTELREPGCQVTHPTAPGERPEDLVEFAGRHYSAQL